MKDRRSFLRNLITAVGLSGLIGINKKTMAAEVKLQGALIHHVFFWLKEPENEAHKKQLIEGLNKLIKVKTIKLSHIGLPAPTEARDVVDHSYSVSYMAMFDSKEDQASYQVDPIHLKFVEENEHLWKKVIVYDATDLLNG